MGVDLCPFALVRIETFQVSGNYITISCKNLEIKDRMHTNTEVINPKDPNPTII